MPLYNTITERKKEEKRKKGKEKQRNAFAPVKETKKKGKRKEEKEESHYGSKNESRRCPRKGGSPV